LRSLELTEQVAAATLLAANQGVWLRQRDGKTDIPAPVAAMREQLAVDFHPVIEDRALEAELRLCLVRIREQHWSLYA
ncbi:MAG: histidine ammonia-lyase, partial [Pseudomonas sp.]|nr:histidine ammonia-lyase [Pseudomonas sp.]